MSTSLDSLSCLVIEDSSVAYSGLKAYLNQIFDRPEVQQAISFGEAKEILSSEHAADIDVILLDLTLPDISVHQLVKAIIELAPHTPVIALADDGSREIGGKAIFRGISDYLLKDEINPELLKSSIIYGLKSKKINISLLRSEKQYEDLFDLNPIPMWVYDLQTLRFLKANQAAVECYGYDEDEFLKMMIGDILPENDLSPIEIQFNSGEEKKKRSKSIGRFLKKDGNPVDVEISSSEILFDGIPARIVLANDITNKLREEQSELKKSRLLAAASDVISSLLKKEEWMTVFTRAFKIIGEAIEADRVYYFEHYTDPDTKENFINQCIEWVQPGIKPEIDNPVLQKVPVDSFGVFTQPLIDGRSFNAVVNELPESETKKILQEQEILSILVIPIFVDNAFYGFIGIDDCTVERIWTDEEIQFLETLASNFAIAIEKKSAIDKLVQSEQRFRSLVQYGSDLISVFDNEANLKYVAPSSKTVLGITEEEFTGKNALDYIHRDDRARIRDIFLELSAEESTYISPFRIRNSAAGWSWLEATITNMTQNPVINGYVMNSRDVTKRILAEEELRQLSLVASKTTDVVVITDQSKKITWVNKAFEKLTGYTFDEAIGNPPGALLHGPETDQETVNRLKRAISKMEPVEEIILNYSKKGKKYWLEMTIDPIFDENGELTHYIAIERDVTQRIKEEERLKLLESVITNSKELVVILEAEPSDGQGRKIIYVNDAFTQMTGYLPEESLGQTLGLLSGPDTNHEELTRLNEAFEIGEPCNVELIHYKKNRKPFWVNLSVVPVTDRKGNHTHWISIGRDVSRRREQEEEIRTSLKEKEILLAEIHHRVKNNLAVISAMLQLQAQKEINQNYADRLLDSVGRIKTIANIHEHLYQSNNFSDVNFTQNVIDLVTMVTEAFDRETLINVKYQCDHIQLNVNQAIPCSLIINEVVTNSFKHAFNGKVGGELFVQVKNTRNIVELAIDDNGIGFTNKNGKATNKSLGLQIISVLSQQLHAEYSYMKKESGMGTRFVLKFKKANIKGSSSSHVIS